MRIGLAIAAALLAFAPARADFTGWTSFKSPTSFTGDPGQWTSMSNVGSSNDVRATSATVGQFGCAHGFGFTTVEIPTGSTILGVEITIEGNSSAFDEENLTVGLEYDVTISSCTSFNYSPVNLTLNQTTDTTQTLGGTSDTFGTDLNDTDARSDKMGVIIYSGGSAGQTRRIDHIQVRFYFEFIAPRAPHQIF